MSDQAIRNLALAIQQHPDEVNGLLKRNGVFTPDNADLPTLNKMTLAALSSSETFRKDMQAWAQSKSGYSSVDGSDPVLDSSTTGSRWGSNVNWGQVFKAVGDTTTALINYRTAQAQNEALLAMNEAQGGNSGENDGVPAVPPQSGGISTTKILLIVGLVGVVGGTIYYFTRK